MLDLAVKAGLPLIAVRTSDVVNFPAVLEHLTGMTPIRVSPSAHIEGLLNPEDLKTPGTLFWTDQPLGSIPGMYEFMVGKGASMVVLNQPASAECFDAGEVPTPPDFVRARLEEAGILPAKVADIMPGLGGLTFKEVGDLVKIAQAETGALTLDGILGARRRCFSQVRGLQLVDLEIPFYRLDARLEAYLNWARPFLLGDRPRLRPRGLLLAGLPGTGKTLAAKRVARVIGVPLFRLDLGAIKGKYVGESEGALRDALAQVDREAPCVLLIDEVEKLFGQTRDEGTTESLLASVLWWMQEHTSRVLTVMTTNDSGKLPPELHRDGRVDRTLYLRPLEGRDIHRFAICLAETFLELTPAHKNDLIDWYKAEGQVENEDVMPQAAVAGAVRNLVRGWLS